jgi:hypothetical protein
LVFSARGRFLILFNKELEQMISKKHRLIVYGVSVQLLLVAIVCYAAFPVRAPHEPLRLMYHTNAGKVLFDHQTHATVKGYALACNDCHHLHGDEEIEPVSCGMCHPPRPKGAAVPESCLECHEDAAEIENPKIMKRSDAFHKQCIGCHEQYGKGPQSGSEQCSKCHVL